MIKFSIIMKISLHFPKTKAKKLYNALKNIRITDKNEYLGEIQIISNHQKESLGTLVMSRYFSTLRKLWYNQIT